jgi:hypothetical protein
MLTGTRVSVTFEATVVRGRAEGGMTSVLNAETGRVNYVDPSQVTQLDPDHWPPQVGDIWEARGREYIIRHPHSVSASSRARLRAEANDPYLIVSPLDADAPTLHGRFDELRAASPVLIRRRAQ